MNHFLYIPNEIKMEIISYLSYVEQTKLSMTNTEFQDLTRKSIQKIQPEEIYKSVSSAKKFKLILRHFHSFNLEFIPSIILFLSENHIRATIRFLADHGLHDFFEHFRKAKFRSYRTLMLRFLIRDNIYPLFADIASYKLYSNEILSTMHVAIKNCRPDMIAVISECHGISMNDYFLSAVRTNKFRRARAIFQSRQVQLSSNEIRYLRNYCRDKLQEGTIKKSDANWINKIIKILNRNRVNDYYD